MKIYIHNLKNKVGYSTRTARSDFAGIVKCATQGGWGEPPTTS